jgi:hypothetical protein
MATIDEFSLPVRLRLCGGLVEDPADHNSHDSAALPAEAIVSR